jgi:hypothetical protein
MVAGAYNHHAFTVGLAYFLHAEQHGRAIYLYVILTRVTVSIKNGAFHRRIFIAGKKGVNG